MVLAYLAAQFCLIIVVQGAAYRRRHSYRKVHEKGRATIPCPLRKGYPPDDGDVDTCFFSRPEWAVEVDNRIFSRPDRETKYARDDELCANKTRRGCCLSIPKVRPWHFGNWTCSARFYSNDTWNQITGSFTLLKKPGKKDKSNANNASNASAPPMEFTPLTTDSSPKLTSIPNAGVIEVVMMVTWCLVGGFLAISAFGLTVVALKWKYQGDESADSSARLRDLSTVRCYDSSHDASDDGAVSTVAFSICTADSNVTDKSYVPSVCPRRGDHELDSV